MYVVDLEVEDMKSILISNEVIIFCDLQFERSFQVIKTELKIMC